MMFEIPALHREFAVAFVQTVQGLDGWLLAEATARIDFSANDRRERQPVPQSGPTPDYRLAP
jgi:hypothetical protein